MKSSGWSRCRVPATSAFTIDSVFRASTGCRSRRDIGQAGAVDRVRGILQHADAARDVAFQLAHARLDEVVGVAERLEAFVLGPFQEGGDFLAARAIGGGLRGDCGSCGRSIAALSRWTTAASRDTICRRSTSADFVLRQVFGQQAQDIGFKRRAGFADGGHNAIRVAATGSTANSSRPTHHALAAQRHHEGIDQVGHVVVQDQQRGRHAAAAVGVTHLGDLAPETVRFEPEGEAIPQDGARLSGAVPARSSSSREPSQAPIRAATCASVAGLFSVTRASVWVRRS
jgi:hypothetical protein